MLFVAQYLSNITGSQMENHEKINAAQLKTIDDGFGLLSRAIAEATQDIKAAIPGFYKIGIAVIFSMVLISQCTTNPISDKVAKNQIALSEIKTSMTEKAELAKVQKQLAEAQNLLVNMQTGLAEIKSQTASRSKQKNDGLNWFRAGWAFK